MDTFWGLSATAWTGIYTILTAGLLLVAVVSAFWAFRQLGAQRRALDEELRPFVTVTVEPSPASMHIFDLVIRNIGRRPAISTTIRMTPPLARARETDEATSIRAMKILNEPIALLAPGQELRVLYDSHLERANKSGLPTEHVVEVTYSDAAKQRYTASFSLDLAALKGASFVELGSIHSISEALSALEKTLSRSALLKKGKLAVNATTETRDEAQQRRVREELEELRSYREDLIANARSSTEIGHVTKRMEELASRLGIDPES